MTTRLTFKLGLALAISFVAVSALVASAASVASSSTSGQDGFTHSQEVVECHIAFHVVHQPSYQTNVPFCVSFPWISPIDCYKVAAVCCQAHWKPTVGTQAALFGEQLLQVRYVKIDNAELLAFGPYFAASDRLPETIEKCAVIHCSASLFITIAALTSVCFDDSRSQFSLLGKKLSDRLSRLTNRTDLCCFNRLVMESSLVPFLAAHGTSLNCHRITAFPRKSYLYMLLLSTLINHHDMHTQSVDGKRHIVKPEWQQFLHRLNAAVSLR